MPWLQPQSIRGRALRGALQMRDVASAPMRIPSNAQLQDAIISEVAIIIPIEQAYWSQLEYLNIRNMGPEPGAPMRSRSLEINDHSSEVSRQISSYGRNEEECSLMTNPFDLTGKVAVVTGANTGIGQGIAVALAQAGAAIAAVGRSSMEETASIVEHHGRSLRQHNGRPWNDRTGLLHS